MQDTGKLFQGQKDVNILMLVWPIWIGDGRKGDLQNVTIENRQSPFYVVNRVTLTGKKTTLNIMLVL